MEKFSIHLANPDSDDCPFCPGKETKHEWITIKGSQNNSTTLKETMLCPERCNWAGQGKARPKNGEYPKQNKDQEVKEPKFSHPTNGAFGFQAHHCISGKEIMEGHALEKIIINESDDDYLGETGYNINNAANGVFLPSYPEIYSGTKIAKYNIVKVAMEAGMGQSHIGNHTGHETAAGDDYPTIIQEELTAFKKRVLKKSKECPFCVDNNGDPKKPFIPPYKLNQWLDNLSRRINRKLSGPVHAWPYFISKYAKDFYIEATANVPSDEDLL